MPGPVPVKLIVCRAGAHRIALAMDGVREVLPLLPINRPPALPRPLLGFIDVRGETLSLVSPALVLDDGQATDAIDIDAHILRLADAALPCLLVDRVEDVATVAADDVRPLSPGSSPNDAFTAEVMLADGVAHLLATDRLLDDAERMRLADLTTVARRRAAEWAAG